MSHDIKFICCDILSDDLIILIGFHEKLQVASSIILSTYWLSMKNKTWNKFNDAIILKINNEGDKNKKNFLSLSL